MLQNQVTPHFKFPKHQRLTHKKRIAELFAVGLTQKSYPFRLTYLPNSLSYHRVLIAVPKRNIPLACNRNQIKRWMREAFRLQQHQLDFTSHCFDMVFSFNAKQKPNYLTVESKFIHLIQQLNTETTSKKSK